MSRCFPYPPPGYCRNGATAHEALIESIKLQKETDKAKAERRKEKRAKKEKKKEEKEKRKNHEKSKSHKNHQSQDPHKSLPKEAQLKGTKPNTEVLEKSDLTQEHGQPIKPCYSSDCTQNSNKRRRDDDNDDGLLPDDSNSHGKQIKIRLLKKHKGSDSIKSVEDARSKTVPFVPSSNLDRTLLVSSNRNNGVPATSGRDNNAVRGIPLTQTKSNTRIERTTERNQNGLHPVRQQSASGSTAKPILPSVSRKSNVEVLKSSRQQQQQQQLPQLQQQIASFARPVVPQSLLKHEIPSSSAVSRNISVQPQGLNAGRQQQGPSALKPGIPGPVLNHLSPITTGKRPISEITNPSSSGPAKLEKKKELKKAGPTRAEKKMMKKHAKYEKLIGSWVPPVFQAILPEVGGEDEDWLSRRTKPANSSISRGEVETCGEVPSTLWQPRARFLAEADIHALPYTIPF
ncbi:hypothetical protein HanPI659440_Chr13g0480961 [Helianthus annuus]|nr:hypothetical protein HanPI659440_Chr13g0480961 [Helianthus annuus]